MIKGMSFVSVATGHLLLRFAIERKWNGIDQFLSIKRNGEQIQCPSLPLSVCPSPRRIHLIPRKFSGFINLA